MMTKQEIEKESQFETLQLILRAVLEIKDLLAEKKEHKEMYQCQSYYNNSGKIVDCTCGKCSVPKEEKYIPGDLSQVGRAGCGCYPSDIVCSKHSAQPEKWKPVVGEKYWFVSPDLTLDYGYNNTDPVWDKTVIKTDNCFKTETEAEIMASQIKALLAKK